MDLHLTGRTAMVAGASSGLGLAIAAALVQEGVNVSVCGRNRDRLAAAERSLTASGSGQVLAIPTDLTDPGDVQGWIDATLDRFGGIDIVVTNSGGVPFGPVVDFTAEAILVAVHENLAPHLHLALATRKHVQDSLHGRLLMITSESVRQPHPDSGLSSIARLGVLGLMKGLVDELGQCGATVNVLAPGFHRTPALDVQFGANVETRVAEVASHLPVRRVGQAEDFGSVVAFLASDHAAFMTGTVVSIDGGNTSGIH